MSESKIYVFFNSTGPFGFRFAPDYRIWGQNPRDAGGLPSGLFKQQSAETDDGVADHLNSLSDASIKALMDGGFYPISLTLPFFEPVEEMTPATAKDAGKLAIDPAAGISKLLRPKTAFDEIVDLGKGSIDMKDPWGCKLFSACTGVELGPGGLVKLVKSQSLSIVVLFRFFSKIQQIWWKRLWNLETFGPRLALRKYSLQTQNTNPTIHWLFVLIANCLPART